MEYKNDAPNLFKDSSQEKSDETLLIDDSIPSELDKELDLRLGTSEEAEKFVQDKEFIKGGYLLNCTTFKKTFRNLLIINNESVNVWSHLLGAIFFFFLIWYTTIFITNLQTQVSNIRSYAYSVADKAKELREQSPDVMHNIYSSMKEKELNFRHFYSYVEETAVYISSFNKINYLYDELKNYTLPMMEYFYKTIKEYYKYFMEAVTSVKEEIIDLINLDTSITKEYESHLDINYNLNLNERKKRN